MKNIVSFILFFAMLWSACGDDNRVALTSLRYDGDNETAPILDADFYEAAAYFPASVTDQFIGQRLTEVSYYMENLPRQTFIKIYEEGSNNTPGSLIYEAELTGSVLEKRFSTHLLSTPIEITGEGLWIAIRFRQTSSGQTIGCDPGPANRNGDWLYSETDGSWTRLLDRTQNAVDINWNIRGTVSE